MRSSSLNIVEISQKNLIHNLKQFRGLVGQKRKIMAMVKANAYGHGFLPIAKIVSQKNKADWLGVNSLEEGLALRQAKIKLPILILGYIPLNDLAKAIENNLSFVVYNLKTLSQASQVAKKLKKPAKVHLKIETGTNRQGIKLGKLPFFIKGLKNNPSLFLEGAYTHFANIEDTLEPDFAQEQLKKFNQAIKILNKAGLKLVFKHAACTAATILFPETYFNLVRVGIGLYGLWPSRETKLAAKLKKKNNLNLKPVLSWKTKVVQVKEVSKGETIGYGRTFKTTRKSKIAILPIGYWDGYDRKLSNTGQVLIKNQTAPIIGRICMNICMADVTDIGQVKPEDEVVLLGKQGKNKITAEDLAQKIETINYEVTTRINPLLERKIV